MFFKRFVISTLALYLAAVVSAAVVSAASPRPAGALAFRPLNGAVALTFALAQTISVAAVPLPQEEPPVEPPAEEPTPETTTEVPPTTTEAPPETTLPINLEPTSTGTIGEAGCIFWWTCWGW